MVRLWPVLLLFVFSAEAQKQLVLLKRGTPVGRYLEGEYIHVVMKDGSRKEGTILELLEFSALTAVVPKNDTARVIPYDTIHFNKIHKIEIQRDQRTGISPLFGGLMMASGAVYLGLDLINSAAGYNTPGIDKGVVAASATLIGAGSILYFIRPKYRRVNNGTFLRTVEYGSKFYHSPNGGL